MNDAVKNQNLDMLKWLFYTHTPATSFSKRAVETVGHTGNLEMLQWMNSISPTQIPYTRDIIRYFDLTAYEMWKPLLVWLDTESSIAEGHMKTVIGTGKLPEIQWLNALFCPPKLTPNDVRPPNIECAEWILKQFPDFIYSVIHLTYAIRHGHIEVAQWLLEKHDILPNLSSFEAALQFGDISNLEWVWNNAPSDVELKTYRWYDYDNHEITLSLPLVKWLFEHGCKRPENVGLCVNDCDTTNPIEIYRFLHNESIPWSDDGGEYWFAMRRCRYDDILWLYEHHCPMTLVLSSYAAEKGTLAMNAYLNQLKCPINPLECFSKTIGGKRWFNAAWLLSENLRSNIELIPSANTENPTSPHRKELFTQLGKLSNVGDVAEVTTWSESIQKVAADIQSAFEMVMISLTNPCPSLLLKWDTMVPLYNIFFTLAREINPTDFWDLPSVPHEEPTVSDENGDPEDLSWDLPL
jgi:hypothetical protein